MHAADMHWTSGVQSNLSLKSESCSWRPQVKRLVERDGCSQDLAHSKVAAQMPADIKQKKSQYIIDNSGTRQSTEAQVRCTALQLSFWKTFHLRSLIFLPC